MYGVLSANGCNAKGNRVINGKEYRFMTNLRTEKVPILQSVINAHGEDIVIFDDAYDVYDNPISKYCSVWTTIKRRNLSSMWNLYDWLTS